MTGQALKGAPLSPSQLAQLGKQKKMAPALPSGVREQAEGPEPEV